MKNVRRVRNFASLGLCLSLGLFLVIGCTAEPKKPMGPRTATSADQVTFYQEKPRKYDLLGTVTVEITPALRWDERGQSTKAFDAIRQKAAEMGANGVLFDIEQPEFDVLASAGYGTEYYQVPIRQKPARTAVAYAIWVYK